MNKQRYGIFLLALFLCLSVLGGCASLQKQQDEELKPPTSIQPSTPVTQPEPVPKPKPAAPTLPARELRPAYPEILQPDPSSMKLLAPDEIPLLTDDLSRDSLLAAIEQSLLFYSRIPRDNRQPMGPVVCTADELQETLLLFQKILQDSSSEEELKEKIADSFDFYQAAGRDRKGTVLFTGYFEPIIKGSIERSDAFSFPIYRPPEETVVINLGRFKSRYMGETLTGRLYGGEVIPHYTREEIDGKGALSGRDLEIAWAEDSVELFFLHIQGSGIMELPDGQSIRVGYARSNGHPFRGLAKVLFEQGKISNNEMSHEAVKRYLQEHPGERAELMHQNPSYVFFQLREGGNVGSHNVSLTAGRSIATDPKYFPRGALALIQSRKPVFTKNGSIMNWVPFSRFVLNQDAGGAIKSTGRVDLFCGTGSDAERVAGSLKENGSLFFLLKKKGLPGNEAATVF